MATDPLQRRLLVRRSALAPALRNALGDPRAPFAFVVLASIAVAALAATVAVNIGAIALDETIIKQSAVHYTSGLPGSLLHDINARGTSRLYSLVLAPIFAAYDGDQAVRVARGLNTLLFASASIPAYLLAVRVTAGRWLAAAAAVLGVAAPWLILTTALYTENFAFPVVIWTVWAIERAVRAPSPARDASALGLIAASMATRTQFGILFVAYWLCATLVPVLQARARGPLADAWPLLGRRWTGGHPFGLGLLVLAGAYVFYLGASGRLHHEVQLVFGAYSEIQDRNHISSDMSLALLVEVVALSLGVGILPAIAAIAWYARALRSGRGTEWTFAFVTVVILALFAFATMYAQGGYLADRTEERYYFYAVPLVWIGAAAAVRGPLMPSHRSLAVAAGGLALLYSVVALPVPLLPETGFLAPVLASLGRLLPQAIDAIGVAGLTPRDLLFAVTLVAFAALAVTWRRWLSARLALVVAVPAVAQLALSFYVFAVARGDVDGVSGRTARDLAASSWVDRALLPGAQASWLNNQLRAEPDAAETQQRATLFWNDQVAAVTDVPAIALPSVQWPLAGLPTAESSLDERTGVLRGAQLALPLVQEATSPQLQLAGTRLASSPDGRLELVRPGAPARARWAAFGLAPDGWAPGGRSARLVAGALPGGRAVRVALSLAAPPSGGVDATVRFGDAVSRVRLAAAASGGVTVVACPKRGVPATGTLRGDRSVRLPDGRLAAVQLTGVAMTPAHRRCGAGG